MEEEPNGRFNKSADLVKRVNKTWSDTNLDYEYGSSNGFYSSSVNEFKRLQCRNCNGLSFEVLKTDDYETAAKCHECGMYYLVHCG